MKARGDAIALKRSLLGLCVAGLLYLAFPLNVFGFTADALEGWRITAFIIYVIVTIFSVLSWVRSNNACLIRGVERFCETTQSPDYTMSRLEETWSRGTEMKAGRMNESFIIYTQGMRSRVIPLEQAVWAYKTARRRGGFLYPALVVFFSDDQDQSYPFYDAPALDQILSYLRENCPDIALGREKEIENLYHNGEIDKLRTFARAQRKAWRLQKKCIPETIAESRPFSLQ